MSATLAKLGEPQGGHHLLALSLLSRVITVSKLYVGSLPFTATDEAVRAMQALNGSDFDGRALKVNEAHDRERSGGANHRPRRF